MHRIGSTRDECLDRGDEQTGHDHGIDSFVRTGTVSASSADVDGEAVGVRRDRAWRHHDFAEPIVVGDVARKNRLDLVQQVGPHNGASAVATFLGWLEDEHDGALWWLSLQERGRAQQHRHVGVVTTGVHLVRYAGGERQSCSLLAGQHVHFGSESDGSARRGSH